MRSKTNGVKLIRTEYEGICVLHVYWEKLAKRNDFLGVWLIVVQTRGPFSRIISNVKKSNHTYDDTNVSERCAGAADTHSTCWSNTPERSAAPRHRRRTGFGVAANGVAGTRRGPVCSTPSSSPRSFARPVAVVRRTSPAGRSHVDGTRLHVHDVVARHRFVHQLLTTSRGKRPATEGTRVWYEGIRNVRFYYFIAAARVCYVIIARFNNAARFVHTREEWIILLFLARRPRADGVRRARALAVPADIHERPSS